MHAGYTYGYNLPLPAQRTQDVLTALHAARLRAGSGVVRLRARGAAAAWAAGAQALTGDRPDDVKLDLAGFRYGSVDRIDLPDFLPGAVKYGDVAALIALGAPNPVTVADDALSRVDEGIAREAYAAAGAAERLTIEASSARP
jgi:hypothetical protein